MIKFRGKNSYEITVMNSYAINYQPDAPYHPRASKISTFGFGIILFFISVALNFISSHRKKKTIKDMGRYSIIIRCINKC